jgi:hypothetical protein
MTGHCLDVREALFTGGGAATAAIADHLAACRACRAWADAFVAGASEMEGDEAFTLDVLLHAELVRLKPAQSPVASHQSPVAIPEELLIPAIDPGPAFTARVLAATSRAAAEPSPWWRRQWQALVQRPRFALEAAYVLTVILMLLAGNPLAAVSRTAERAEPLVERLAPAARALDTRLDAVRTQVSAVTMAAANPAGPGWFRTMTRRLAAPIARWLARLATAAESAAGWIERQLDEPGTHAARSS